MSKQPKLIEEKKAQPKFSMKENMNVLELENLAKQQ